jgi:Ca-activated chloride channel family protein
MLSASIRALLAVAAVVAAPSVTQSSPGGRIGGHIRDASGSPLAGAQVIVVGTSFHAVTNSTGAYWIDSIPPGTYAVRATLTGYASAEVASVELRAGQRVKVDIVLQAAAVGLAEVVVSGAVAQDRARANLPATLQASGYAQRPDESYRGRREPWNTEEYGHEEENPFLAVSAHPLSTFSIDVDRASYSNVRRFIVNGQAPPCDAVRIEELVNYFPYDYAAPTGDDPVAIHTELAPAPWKRQHQLLRIGLQARRIDLRGLPASNLVFLLDVSGSMATPNKLPLVKASMTMLVNNLRRDDRVAIVVYAGSAGLVLASTPGDEKAKILEALDRLEAGGSTAGGAGIRRAYDEAVANFIRGGNNRVILATDGDFNVGVSSNGELIRLIEEKRRSGVFLTVLGFGMGNLKDSKMEQLADHGNGNYAYIDNLLEARKTLVHELGGTLFTIAKDVKIQVEFNPARVRAYRLIGYENRLLADEDFADDAKDAGEMGAGHSVTALYEIVPAGVETDVTIRVPDSLRYQTVRTPRGVDRQELGFVKVRYKQPDGDRSLQLTHAVSGEPAGTPSPEFRFQTAVAEFGLLLRGSEQRGTASFEDVIATARGSLGRDPDGYRAEFVRLAEAAQSLGLASSGTTRHQ